MVRMMLAFSLAMAVSSVACVGQSFDFVATSWRTGRQLDEGLREPISLVWSEAPLRATLNQFSKDHRIAIFLDRRIDPGTLVSAMVRNVNARQLLWLVARDNGWGVCRLDDVLYVGPEETAATLPLLWDELKRESSRLKRKTNVPWHKSIPMTTNRFTVPGEMVSQFAVQHQFQLIGTDIPHDLWQPLDLPKMRLDQQIGLYVVGFGLWLKRNGNGEPLEVIAFPDIKQGKRLLGSFEDSREQISALRARFPGCRLSLSGQSVSGSGPLLDLLKIERELILSEQDQKTTRDASHTYSVTTRAARGAILASIAQQEGLTLEIDPAAHQALSEDVQLDLREVSLTELINKTLENSGLQYELLPGQLKVRR